jgi:sodium/bile acid cotransporter 7
VAGLGLKTEEFESASKEILFNAFVQVFNFGAVSLLVYGFSRILLNTGALVEPLADGMLICACLPMAINMVFILTKTAGGDEAAAILNASFANMIGVFLSPLLILGYLGVSGDDVNLVDVFYKLAVRIVIPLIIGQIIHKRSTRVVHWMKTYARHVKRAQIYALVFIVYTVFCTTFSAGTRMPMESVMLMMFLQFVLLCGITVVAWFSLRFLFFNKPELCVMGLFGCTHKTVSVGVPLINAMYEGNLNVGLYTLPLLIWHPMQLLVGSILAPKLKAYVERERLQLKTQTQQPTETTNDDDPVIDEQSPLVLPGSSPIAHRATYV